MKLIFTTILILWKTLGFAQTVTSFVPTEIDTTATYMFYLHGGIVQEQGVNAVSKDFGPYEYLKIVDSLKSHNYHVISEVRIKGTNETFYAKKVAKQIDSLLNKGLSSKQIVVIGASQGAFITIEVADILKNSEIKYIIMAICNDYNINYYKRISKTLCGKFLSIYERSDNKGSCKELLNKSDCLGPYKEVALNMGNRHGFIYKPYKEWIYPIVNWIKIQK